MVNRSDSNLTNNYSNVENKASYNKIKEIKKENNLNSKTNNLVLPLIQSINSEESKTSKPEINNSIIFFTNNELEEIDNTMLSIFDEQAVDQVFNNNETNHGNLNQNNLEASLFEKKMTSLEDKEKLTSHRVTKNEQLLNQIKVKKDQDEKLLTQKVTAFQTVHKGYIIMERVDENQQFIKNNKELQINGLGLNLPMQHFGNIKSASTDSPLIHFDEKLLRQPIKGAIFREDLGDIDLELFDFDNIPASVAIYKVGKLSEDDKKEISTLLQNYFTSSLELHLLEKQLQNLMSNKQQIDDKTPQISSQNPRRPILPKQHPQHEPHNSKSTPNEKKTNVNNYQNLTLKETVQKAQELKQIRRHRKKLQEDLKEERVKLNQTRLFNEGLVDEAHMLLYKKVDNQQHLEKTLLILNSLSKEKIRFTDIEIKSILDIVIKNQVDLQENKVASILFIVEESLNPLTDNKTLIRKLKRYLRGLRAQEMP